MWHLVKKQTINQGFLCSKYIDILHFYIENLLYLQYELVY